MQATWFSGGPIDIAATSAGFAIVRVDGLDIVCSVSTTTSGEPVESWRVTASEPIDYLRCACRTDTNEVRAIGQGRYTGTARYFTSTAEASKGTAFGVWPVALQYTGGDWVGYIARTGKTYTRWPFAGAEPAAVANPFTVVGTNLGMIQVIGSTVTWREALTGGGKPRTVVVSSVTLVYPMVVSGVTVGQSLGPPTNSHQIIAAHDSTLLSTIFPMQGYDPHVAVLADGTFAITARTTEIELPGPQPLRTTGFGGAALAVGMPPWADYNALASSGPNKLLTPWDRPLGAESDIDKKTGQLGNRLKLFLEKLKDRSGTSVNLGSVSVTGGSGGAPSPPAPLGTDADVMVGSDGVGFTNARVATTTNSVSVDVSAANIVRFNATSLANSFLLMGS